MKVYAIAAGEYSDYGIIWVTLDKEKAEEFCKLHENDNIYDRPFLEEFDTDDFDKIQIHCIDSNSLYEVVLDSFGRLNVYTMDMYEYNNAIDRLHGVEKICENAYRVYVAAEDEDHAKKIGMDYITMYQYREKIENGQ